VSFAKLFDRVDKLVSVLPNEYLPNLVLSFLLHFLRLILLKAGFVVVLLLFVFVFGLVTLIPENIHALLL
jgi:hypothetical protein